MVGGVHDPETGLTVTRSNADGRNFRVQSSTTHPIIRQRVKDQQARVRIAQALSDSGIHARDLSDADLRARMIQGGVSAHGIEPLEQMRRTSDRVDYFTSRSEGKLTDTDRDGMYDEVGPHGETLALNEILNARDRQRAERGQPMTTESELGNIALYNQRLPHARTHEMVITGMPRCDSCQGTTAGVAVHPELAASERTNVERDALRRSTRRNGESE
jgi:hypothetical protein